MKTLVFTEFSTHDLQIKIDEFLGNHTIKELFDIKFSTCMGNEDIYYSAMIIYKT